MIEILPDQNLCQSVRAVRGRVIPHAPLGAGGWFKCGGQAQLLFKPEDVADLALFLNYLPETMAIQAFGALSNVIIRDGGLQGVTLRLGRGFGDIIRVDDHHIRAGAMALDVNVARFSAEWHIDGMAFLSGIPGTIGGALRMNAGAYGRELKDILVSATVMDRTGRVFEIAAQDMNLSYRHNDLPHDFIFLSALLRGELGKEEDIQRQIADIKQKREDSQPIREKTGGSTFANPDAVDLERAGLSPDTKTWQLVDRVGGRGLCVGGAQMSEKHCNFMINTGTATATDLESLGDLIRDRVQQEFGITLRWEIKRLGEFKALAP